MSSGSYATLLDGKSVLVEAVKGTDESSGWSRVVLDGGIHILSSKEVSGFSVCSRILANITAFSTQASNGVLYMIDETIKID